MSMNRREFAQMLGLAGAAGMFPGSVFAARKAPSELYEVPPFGDVYNNIKVFDLLFLN
jgi:sulfur-oxidizing protein SoxB